MHALRRLVLGALALDGLACAGAASGYPAWMTAPPSREWCVEADSIVAAGPDTTYRYASALSSRRRCHRDGWKRLALVWHENRTATDSLFLVILGQASRGPIERPTLDTMLGISQSASASYRAREAAFRELMFWRIPGVYVNDSAIAPWPGGPGCHTEFFTDALLDPPPASVASRMDRMLVDLTADTTYPHLRRLSGCYLEHLATDDAASPEVRHWAAGRRKQR